MKDDEQRYYVDLRLGCVAVMDREKVDPDNKGFHGDTDGVVKYWHGRLDRCQWTLDNETVRLAHDLCDALNLREGRES